MASAMHIGGRRGCIAAVTQDVRLSRHDPRMHRVFYETLEFEYLPCVVFDVLPNQYFDV